MRMNGTQDRGLALEVKDESERRCNRSSRCDLRRRKDDDGNEQEEEVDEGRRTLNSTELGKLDHLPSWCARA